MAVVSPAWNDVFFKTAADFKEAANSPAELLQTSPQRSCQIFGGEKNGRRATVRCRELERLQAEAVE